MRTRKRPLFFALFSIQRSYFAGSFEVWERLVSEGISNVASTASEYPLANFEIFRSLARKFKMLVGIVPNPYEERRRRMANRKRNIQMKFYVTEDEKRLIDEKMSQLPTRRYGAYLRKMAIDGYIIYTDTADIKAFTKELSAIGRNINQIAKLTALKIRWLWT